MSRKKLEEMERPRNRRHLSRKGTVRNGTGSPKEIGGEMTDYRNSDNPRYIPQRKKRWPIFDQKKIKQEDRQVKEELIEITRQKFGQEGLEALLRLKREVR